LRLDDPRDEGCAGRAHLGLERVGPALRESRWNGHETLGSVRPARIWRERHRRGNGIASAEMQREEPQAHAGNEREPPNPTSERYRPRAFLRHAA
jgi:hypothetical protein